MTIRGPRPEDLPSLLLIEHQCFKAHRFTEAQFKYYLAVRNSIFAVAESGGELVGYAAGIADERGHSRNARLYSMAVLRERRRSGIGASLLGRFEAEALEKGCRSITLEVDERNRPALTLYRSFGYVKERRLADYYGPGEHGIRMRKILKTKERS
jgi:ribosomal protein S18 acetylase RimI-like enzyme